MKKAFSLAIAAAMSAAAPAAAGDFSEFRPVGFSPDGRVFAFEEFGVQDGSGFPYANRYYINTETDSFLTGTPFRVRFDREDATVADARDEAAEAAAGVEADSGASAEPGVFAAFAPATELGNDGGLLRYRSMAVEPAPSTLGPNSVELLQRPVAAPAGCEGLDGPIQGFRLTMKEKAGTAADVLLHEDKHVPRSRNCPLSYSLAGALTHANPDGTTTHAILVLVRSVGFEGPNGRYIAVTARLD